MIKQWSIVVKLSFICFLLLFVALPIRSAADSYLGDDGKIQFKVDRFEDKDQEKNKREHKETELDKASIELFNKDIEEEIQKKKKKEQKEMESLRDSLFIKQKENNSVKNTKNSLFSSEYVVRKSADEVASNQTMNEKPISTTIIILLGGSVLLICIGIYTVLRKSWR
ncbi:MULTISPECIES: type VII secretion protein EssA [Bacillus]|nr:MULTISPECIES: type VII secretion protein EssA [Bacillus]EJS66544.1 type VII secretion protein EssA [Bacillus wiedmannii]EJV66486.1 type VII secretion protein EssA [Bacillus wiedmannii]MDF9666037.1 type VII secretion protein EssA [Bacillus wiedmannii]MDI6503448.1 type VII secretion protein EssA [Bacillus wiedmannii]MDI6513547.1 type VII secretion protein EssA [Bacillus wiedmannii]